MNTNPETGIRYGVIALNNLEGFTADDLFYNNGTDLSFEEALAELRREALAEAEEYEDQVRIEISETDPALRDNDQYVERKIEEMWSSRGYDDAQDYVDAMVEHRMDQVVIEEPIIEGEYEGVKYRIGWLGGAPLLWVLEGPVGRCRALCSPCVPNAGDLDSGFILGQDIDPDTLARWGHAGYECYVVPRDWLREDAKDEESET